MDPDSYELQLYVARSSFGSMFAKRPFKDEYSDTLPSNFQKRTLAMDLRKTAIARFEALAPDIVLVDLIDERFDLIQMPSGGRCTYSNELVRSGFKASSRMRVSSSSDEFFQHWHAGWRQFVDVMDARALRGSVVVNRCFYASHTASGTPFNAEEVQAANERLGRMYAAQEKDLEEHQFLDYPGPRSCPDDHRWGPQPFHYDDASNDFAAQWIQRFYDARRSS